MSDGHMEGIVDKNSIPTASDVQFQKTNPLARGDKTIKPLEVFAEHAEIRKLVHNEINKLYVTLSQPIVLQSINITIDRFLGCLSPLKNLHDPGRLPVYATSTRSTIPDKRSCVWVLVSCLVQAYWEYELGDAYELENRIKVGTLLSNLIAINDRYPEMKIAGAENKGYWLEL